MAELKGTNVAAGIVPFTSEDKYATHDAQYGKGGFRSVATIAERDAIPIDRKTEGMVVRVQADKKHYVWESNAWTEWLPKGNVTVDTALNINSNNAISNKAVTTKFNAQDTLIGTVQTTANNAIPKANITTDITQGVGVDTKVPSEKAVTTAIATVVINLDTKISANRSLIGQAQATADAAIPKSKIAAEGDELKTDDATQVPSSKALSQIVVGMTNSFHEAIGTVNDKATQAKATADAAIPKANIAQTLTGNTTRQDLVPSVKLVNDSIKSAIDNIPEITVDAALNSTSVNPVQNKVITARINAIELFAATTRNDLDLADAAIDDLGTTVSTQTKSIQNISDALSPIKTAWDKKNTANGLVQLDGSAKLPASVLPAGYDNVDMLVAFVTANPTTGMTIGQKWYNTTTKKIFTATSATSGSETAPDGNEKIYINIALNKSYRWTGSDMVVVGDGSGVALGTTSTTAFRGDYGNILYNNFGYGANLSNTTAARTFFANITETSEKYINSATVDYSNNEVDLNVGLRYFTGQPSTSETITLSAASESQAGVMTSAMYQTLQELELQAFPLTLSLTGAGTFEVGQSTKNPISIRVNRKGILVTMASTVLVSSAAVGTLSAQKDTWTPTNNITSNTSVKVIATYGAQSQEKSISYAFKYKKYWGVSNKATLTNADILALAGSTWADSRAMNATNFDCTGGKYPYYVIPTSIYTGLEVWVGGLKNTDLVTSTMTVTNASGGSTSYTIVRLANIQTGVLSIQFK